MKQPGFRDCYVCGERFEDVSGAQRLCSEKCFATQGRRRHGRSCRHCGEPIDDPIAPAFCNEECFDDYKQADDPLSPWKNRRPPRVLGSVEGSAGDAVNAHAG